MSDVSTHVLDTGTGRPAADLRVTLERESSPKSWAAVGAAHTDDDGRVPGLMPAGHTLRPGTYRLRFDTGAYFAARERGTLYPYVEIVFAVAQAGERYHVPLLLSPWGYTTYRGS